MKRILLGTLFAAASFNAFADAPGGAGCGWGNMLFKGQRGVATHVVAATTNGTSGNNTFGMTTGTNGCHTNGALSYGGKPLLVGGAVRDAALGLPPKDLDVEVYGLSVDALSAALRPPSRVTPLSSSADGSAVSS